MGTAITPSNNFLLYTNQNGGVKVDFFLKDETIWLTIKQMAALFDIDKSGILLCCKSDRITHLTAIIFFNSSK